MLAFVEVRKVNNSRVGAGRDHIAGKSRGRSKVDVALRERWCQRRCQQRLMKKEERDYELTSQRLPSRCSRGDVRGSSTRGSSSGRLGSCCRSGREKIDVDTEEKNGKDQRKLQRKCRRANSRTRRNLHI